MIETSKSSFLQQANTYGTVPISARVVADTLTPIQLFETFNERAAFLLESRDPLSLWSKYSFIGLDPFLYLEESDGSFLIKNHEGDTQHSYQTFIEAWNTTLARLNVSPHLPDIPFPGGAVGSFSFEAMCLQEEKIQRGDQPAASFVFCQTIMAFHHEREELQIIHFKPLKEGKTRLQSYKESIADVKSMIGQLSKGDTPISRRLFKTEKINEERILGQVKSNVAKADFMRSVDKVKNYIEAGDVFQVVLSQRFEMETTIEGLELYRVLRKLNPSPYMFYIRTLREELVGSSPERLVKVEKDRTIDIHPIAGTRKRGGNEAEDEHLAKDLLADEKERAEHFMLVDLARNDLGKVCKYGTVDTFEMLTVTKFSHVMHLISKVKGELKESTHPIDALLSAHPAGTVSGAPKIRAAEIIQELEVDSRGTYAGTVAYCSFNDTIDSCIAIRTIRLKEKKAYIQAGAGVVYDSVPELEWEETRNKALALINAVHQAKENFTREGIEL
ncbi:anthranilate synthase component I family protein [Alteribacter populi]|uniref:anthranilate synthase component I family protein n=1 Tax=Alteribacter populi TaxID=2011011 RepID=UPI000BBAF29A|nr:chorismate-binding protein [Alteribacter populi]